MASFPEFFERVIVVNGFFQMQRHDRLADRLPGLLPGTVPGGVKAVPAFHQLYQRVPAERGADSPGLYRGDGADAAGL